MKKRELTLYWFINCCVFIMVFILGSLFPFVNDDLIYADGLHTTNPIEALWLSLDKVREFYFIWSGRLVGNFFAFYMAIIDKSVYNVCNAIMHVILANIINGFVWHKKKTPWMILVIYLGIWLFVPEYGMVLIWTNASTIYMWAQIPLLLFALVYYRTIENREQEENSILKSTVYSIGMIILGTLAGNSMEPTAATMLVMGFFWLIWCIKTKRGVRIWEITGIVGFFIGFAISIFSPGNKARSEAVRKIVGDINPVKEIALRIVRETYYSARFIFPVFGICLALWIIAFALQTMNDNHLFEENFSLSAIKKMIILRWKEPLFIISALLSIYMMTFSIAFALRIFLAPTILLIISIGISLKDISECLRNKSKKVYSYYCCAGVLLLTFICVFVLAQYVTAIVEMYHTGEAFVKTTIFVGYNQDLF